MPKNLSQLPPEPEIRQARKKDRPFVCGDRVQFSRKVSGSRLVKHLELWGVKSPRSVSLSAGTAVGIDRAGTPVLHIKFDGGLGTFTLPEELFKRL